MIKVTKRSLLFLKDLTKNKSIYLDIKWGFPTNWFTFHISLTFTTKQNHAGLYFSFELFDTFDFELEIKDKRYWSYESNSWKVYNQTD